MRHTLSHRHRSSYVTAPAAPPIIFEGRMERKLFTALLKEKCLRDQAGTTVGRGKGSGGRRSACTRPSCAEFSQPVVLRATTWTRLQPEQGPIMAH